MPVTRRPLFFALCLALSALAGQAQADQAYECAIKQVSANGPWLPEVVVVGTEGGSTKPVVYDPLIDHFAGHPIAAKIDTDNDKRITYAWELKIKSGSNQHSRMRYRLTVTKKTLAAQMTAQPLGYEDIFIATGSCKKVKL